MRYPVEKTIAKQDRSVKEASRLSVNVGKTT